MGLLLVLLNSPFWFKRRHFASKYHGAPLMTRPRDLESRVATHTFFFYHSCKTSSATVIVRSLPAHSFKLTVCRRVADGVRAVPEGSGQLHPAEGARLEGEGPPPAAVDRRLTLPAVLGRAHRPLGEVLRHKTSGHCTESDELELFGV